MIEGLGVDLHSLSDYEDIPEIVEDGRTFLENALKKARIVSEHTGEMVLADDSGLEVEHLGGKPGIRSSRYSGDGATDESNIRKLLEELKGVPREERRAAFHCVLVFYKPGGSYHTFEGLLEGVITCDPAGEGGFGYDPVFFLPEEGLTVAQLPPNLKNGISHRGRAFRKFKKFLQEEILNGKIGA